MQIETDCRRKFSDPVFILQASKTSMREIISVFAITCLIAFPLSSPVNASNPLLPYAVMESLAISECSGIAKSSQFENVYWVHNDSAGGSDLFAINRLGNFWRSFPLPYRTPIGRTSPPTMKGIYSSAIWEFQQYPQKLGDPLSRGTRSIDESK